jgi:hypothetical protein
MLNAFICPAWRLDELAPFLRGRRERFPLSIIIRPGGNLAADIGNAMDFGERFDAVEIVAVEGKLAAVDAGLAREVDDRLRERRVGGKYWFETGFPDGWPRSLPDFVDDLPGTTGLKVRCGGLDAEAFPSIVEVATAIRLCAERNRPIKATAGLHHPVRHHDAAIGTKMHGFLNVFGAIVLAEVHHLDQNAIVAILAEEDPKAFTFTEDTFAWRDLTAEAGDLGFMTSFGSCSFDEPREDLRALGIM